MEIHAGLIVPEVLCAALSTKPPPGCWCSKTAALLRLYELHEDAYSGVERQYVLPRYWNIGMDGDDATVYVHVPR